MSNKEKIALIFRAAYGAKNGFAPLIGVLEEKPEVQKGEIHIFLTEEDPLPQAKMLESKGYKPVILYGLSTLVYLDLRHELRKVSQRYIVIAGGPHAEGAYWQLLRDGVNIAVVGDGEIAIDLLVDYLLGEIGIEDVPNIAYREGEKFVVTKIQHIDLDNYKGYTESFHLYPPIEIMRGCPYRCKFCQVPWLFKKKVRYRSLESVSRIVEHYVYKGGKRRIRFTAPIGFAYMSYGKEINYEAIEELLKLVRSYNATPFLGTFPSEVRPEYIDKRILKIVKRYAGNKKISIGLQSGSNRLLSSMLRDHTVEDVIEAVKLVIEEGLVPIVDMIFGLPGETDEDVKETIKVMEELVILGARLRLHTFMPLPGSPLAYSRPQGIHEQYRRFVRRMLGKGVLEGYWREQEEWAWKIYCLMISDPSPTPVPSPIEDPKCTSVS